jgi:hypothetical protein
MHARCGVELLRGYLRSYITTHVPALPHREGLEPKSGLEPVDKKDGWATA